MPPRIHAARSFATPLLATAAAVLLVVSPGLVGCVSSDSPHQRLPVTYLSVQAVEYETGQALADVRIFQIYYKHIPFTLTSRQYVEEVGRTDGSGSAFVTLRPGFHLSLERLGYDKSSVTQPGGKGPWMSNAFSEIEREEQDSRLEVVMVPTDR